MWVNNSKFCLNFLNKLVHEYNNNYHCSKGKEPIHANYSTLTKDVETNPKKFNLK